MEKEPKQGTYTKDDINQKFVPEEGDCLADAIDAHTKEHDEDPGVGSVGNKRVPFKVK